MGDDRPARVRMISDCADVRIGFGSWPFVVAVGASLISAALAVVLCLSVSQRNADRGRAARVELQRTQCAIVVALDDNFQDVPPSTELGRRNAASMSQLRTALGC